ncbi:plasma membrane fusion protein PRM1 [Apodospora peruviana]|uniref:Plasma membrane fusion protein PRM1 n=1 Tax=Apodospora peruviana TaxID=516989 RepID=A0AAE0HS55_9PEZI|nr:plasma membrane fusion protein PRM1 [Apodospora peruviana]
MAYGEKTGGIPPIPSSLNANTNTWETVDLNYGSQANETPLSRLYPDTDPNVTPYLGLRARLSQLWFNRWTVLLLLVLVRVVILTGSLNEDIGEAKLKALSACTKVEDIGSAMASMPHYLSVGVNSLAADSITKVVHGMVEILMMILTGVEGLLMFIINMYIGTYACLIAAFIHGGLDAGVKAVQGATDFINKQIGPITDSIAGDVKSFQDAVNKFGDAVNAGIGSVGDAADTIGGIIGARALTVPKIDITPHLDDLKNIKVDSSEFLKDLVQLNKTIPTFDEAENLAKNAIGIPFDLVKQQITSAFGNYSFDRSIFPVAQKQALSFCSSNSFLNDFFTKLFEIVTKAKIAFIVVIIILAILAMFVMGYLEVRRWRREKERARTFTEKGYDPMDIVYMASRTFSAGLGVKIASKFRGNERRYLLIRWAIAYGTSLPALFVLSLAIAGFFSCLCQYILLQSIQKEAPALANQVGDFAGEVVNTLENVSTAWADDANSGILNLQQEINDDVFGWVLNATSAVNNTLNVLDEEIDKGLNIMFKDTILLDVARTIVGCVITRKIETVEKGLTWVHDNAHVTLPLFPNDTFSSGAQASVQGDSDLTSFLASPASVTTDEISGAVDRVVESIRHNLVQEALISTALLLVYILIVMIGVMSSLVAMVGPNKTRAEGGMRYNITHTTHNAGVGHHRPPPPPPTMRRTPAAATAEDESPAYEEVVYAGSVPRGKTEISSGGYGHQRKSSYPQWEDNNAGKR